MQKYIKPLKDRLSKVKKIKGFQISTGDILRRKLFDKDELSKKLKKN